MKKIYRIIVFSTTILFFYSALAQNRTTNLPSWLFKTENYNRIDLAIGISEPGSDTTKALEQAKLNAMLNYSLRHDATITSLTNVGMGSQQDDNKSESNLEYILFTSIIKGKLPSLSIVSVKEKFFTSYGEAVVLVEINNDLPGDSAITDYLVTRSAGFQKENNLFPMFIDELEFEVFSDDSMIYSQGIAKEGQKYFEIKPQNEKHSFFDIPDFKSAMFYPVSGGQKKDSKWPEMASPLGYGLWMAYFFNLIDQLSLYNNMDINCQYKLSSTNTGTLDKSDHSLSFQQLIYSLKNVQASELKYSIDNIYISDNHLFMSLITGKGPSSSVGVLNPSKAEKKIIKKMLEEKWQCFGNDNLSLAWLGSKNLCSQKDSYISTEVELQASSLQSGIIEGFQLSKLQISSLLATKVQSIGKTEISNQDNLAIKSAKLINVEKTGCISPYFIFYRTLAPNIFHIRMVVLYDLNQTKNF